MSPRFFKTEIERSRPNNSAVKRLDSPPRK